MVEQQQDDDRDLWKRRAEDAERSLDIADKAFAAVRAERDEADVRAKQAAKPTGSALPVALNSGDAQALAERLEAILRQAEKVESISGTVRVTDLREILDALRTKDARIADLEDTVQRQGASILEWQGRAEALADARPGVEHG
jgi:hypothetical protein